MIIPEQAKINVAQQLPKSTVTCFGGRSWYTLKKHDLKRAKPAVFFGGKFQIIDFTLSNCLNSGIRRIGNCNINRTL